MIRTESTASFLEAQLIEIDNILKGCVHSATYESRRNSILRKLEFKYMRLKFNEPKKTFRVMSRV